MALVKPQRELKLQNPAGNVQIDTSPSRALCGMTPHRLRRVGHSLSISWVSLYNTWAEAEPSASCRIMMGVQMAIQWNIERPTESRINIIRIQLSSSRLWNGGWVAVLCVTFWHCCTLYVYECVWKKVNSGNWETEVTSNADGIDVESDML